MSSHSIQYMFTDMFQWNYVVNGTGLRGDDKVEHWKLFLEAYGLWEWADRQLQFLARDEKNGTAGTTWHEYYDLPQWTNLALVILAPKTAQGSHYNIILMFIDERKNIALDCIYIRLHKYSVKIPIITMALELWLHYFMNFYCSHPPNALQSFCFETRQVFLVRLYDAVPNGFTTSSCSSSKLKLEHFLALMGEDLTPPDSVSLLNIFLNSTCWATNQ
jgi:hypothetical protein